MESVLTRWLDVPTKEIPLQRVSAALRASLGDRPSSSALAELLLEVAPASSDALAQIVLELAPPMDARLDDGRGALHICRSSLVAARLIRAGCSPRSTSHWGQTPLHCYCEMHSREALMLASEVLDAGADPNASNSAGETPLHRVARTAHITPRFEPYMFQKPEFGSQSEWNRHLVSMASLLVGRGAAVKFRSREGKTALELLPNHAEPELRRAVAPSLFSWVRRAIS